MYIIYNEEQVKTNKNEKQQDKNETNKEESIYYT